ncbi:MAG: ester cyclase [Mycobacterium sp.]
MTSKRLETVRKYWEATSRADWPAAGKCVGPAYQWIEHGTGVVAKTVEQLLAANADEEPWSDVSFEIGGVFETGDALVVQAVRRGTITGSWRSMEATGQSVSFPLCTIFKFNADELIMSEEAYYDMSAVARQLGYELAGP